MYKSYILVLGDTYGHFSIINKMIRLVESNLGFKLDYVFHTGNSGLFNGSEIRHYINNQELFDREVLMVHGNHDSKELIEDIVSKKIRIERLKVFKPGGEILHIRICGTGVDILAIGGSPHSSPNVDFPYSENDFLSAKRVWEGKNKPKINFLLTHEGPTGVGPIGNQFFGSPDSVGSELLRDLWLSVRPDYHFYGRYHCWNEYQEDGLKSLSIPDAHSEVCVLEITRFNRKFTYEVHRLDPKTYKSFNLHF